MVTLGRDAGGIEAGTVAANQVCQHHLSECEHLGFKVTLSPFVRITSLASVLNPQPAADVARMPGQGQAPLASNISAGRVDKWN